MLLPMTIVLSCTFNNSVSNKNCFSKPLTAKLRIKSGQFSGVSSAVLCGNRVTVGTVDDFFSDSALASGIAVDTGGVYGVVNGGVNGGANGGVYGGVNADVDDEFIAAVGKGDVSTI